jgi:adenine/guanine phosphoribosyltransferase-like PRPP-binding protein
MIYHGAPESLVDLEKNVRCVTTGLRYHASEFDFIAVSGMSGVVVGAPAALRLHKPLVIVRKESDQNTHHVGGTIIGYMQLHGRYVIVDDFVSSGRTHAFIRERIEREAQWLPENPPEFVGYFSYADDMWYECQSA